MPPSRTRVEKPGQSTGLAGCGRMPIHIYIYYRYNEGRQIIMMTSTWKSIGCTFIMNCARWKIPGGGNGRVGGGREDA